MPARRTLTTLLVVALVLVAGCAGTGSNGGDEVEMAADEQPEATATPAASGGDAAEDQAGSGGVDVPEERQIIRTAEVRLRIDDYESARENLTAAARAQGGYVGDASQRVREVGNETFTRGTVTFRVPAGNFSGFMATVEGEGVVKRSETNTRDVTRELVDINARLENLRAERDRLRELYEDANETEDVLMVEERLAEVQGEIERLEGQKRYLENQVAYATVTVHLSEPAPEPDRPAPEHWYDTPLLEAFLESVSGVVTALRALLVATAYVLPYALTIAVPIGGAALAARWLRDGSG